jgi:phage shock protein A
MQPSEKYHAARLKSIQQTISKSESEKKSIEVMIAKMQRTLQKLVDNSAAISEKLSKYRYLYDKVKNDPEYNMSQDETFNK